MIVDNIRADLTAARKEGLKNVVTILSTVLGEMTANATLIDGEKVVTDEAATAVLRKTIKGIDELLTYNPDHDAYIFERNYLLTYLPQQLTEEEILDIVSDYRAENPDAKLGDYMSFFKNEYQGLYDGKRLSNLVRDNFF